MSVLKRAAVVAVCIGGIGFTIAATMVEPVRFRVALIAEKAQGRYQEASWGEFLRMLKPGSGIWLAELPRWNSLFPLVKNPFRAPADLAAGKSLFAAHCSTCHGADGAGGVGPSLRGRISPRTESDWAAFLTVRYGVPGTPMTGLATDWRDTWQLAGYVRSMVTEDRRSDASVVERVPPVPFDRLRNADATPQDWLTHSGSYASHRFSRLHEITADNVRRLRVAWIFQAATDYGRLEATPLVTDGRLYVSYPPDEVVALDASTGKTLWEHSAGLPTDLPEGSGWKVNRGVALLGDKVFVATLDARVKALDVATGRVVWQRTVADYKQGYSFTSAPLAIDGAIVIGNSGGDMATRGFIVALDAATGEERWRFETIAKPSESGAQSWAGNSWKRGGVAPWMSGSYDSDLQRIYWGLGNPAPDHYGAARRGDNLYSNSLVALDATTGKLLWHFQFTPHDLHDWDSTQVPVIGPGDSRSGRILFANRNGFLYSLERATGRFVWGKPFVKQTWAASLGPDGRPVRLAGAEPSPAGTVVYPSAAGATNWWSPAYDVQKDVFYVPFMERGGIFYLGREAEPEPAKVYLLGSSSGLSGEPYYTGIKAFRGSDGTVLWEHRNAERNDGAETGGLLATAGGIVFGSDLDRIFAIDAASGQELWGFASGGRVAAPPMSYSVDGKQYVAVCAGTLVIAFALAP
ncbi:MAG TPA: PQQ-binding-like beta-propeller repeat protein [Steroidobacteraceae bacterium]|jgi:alcohol dehydrogenase (cytochrome c)|nr:PQQ-binding-like beta-propeller repeat protein [Steroidobacteraceae bacterium]